MMKTKWSCENRSRLRKFATCEISQVAKFHTANFFFFLKNKIIFFYICETNLSKKIFFFYLNLLCIFLSYVGGAFRTLFAKIRNLCENFCRLQNFPAKFRRGPPVTSSAKF